MSRWSRGFVLAAVALAGCAAWPRVSCSPESLPVSVYLDAIERLVEQHNPPQKDQIIEAVFVCGANAHSGSVQGGPLTPEKHCQFVVAAYRWAFRKDFAKCLGQMMHGTGLGTPAGPDIQFLTTWPDIQCGDLTAREMLEFIRVRLDGPGGLGVGDPMRAQILLKLNACLAHPASGGMLTLEQHCAKVQHAFTEAAKAAPIWPTVLSELEHMP